MLERPFDELKLLGSLPSPTGIGLSILRLTQREDFSIGDIGRAVQSDPALTGRIIKLATDSSLFSGFCVAAVYVFVMNLLAFQIVPGGT